MLFAVVFHCLFSFAVNVLVSILWVLERLRWPLGILARELAIKTTMGHTGKTWQDYHCSNLDTVRFTLRVPWDIFRLLEGPMNDLMN